MKTYGGEWRYSYTIPDLGTGWKRVFSFTPLPLYPRGKKTGTYWIERWVGPRAGLEAMVKLKILPLPGIELQPSLYRLSSPGSTILIFCLISPIDWKLEPEGGHTDIRGKAKMSSKNCLKKNSVALVR
jgi:hypothetical protein